MNVIESFWKVGNYKTKSSSFFTKGFGLSFHFYENGYSDPNPFISFCFIYGHFHIKIPLYKRTCEDYDNEPRHYGFNYYQPTHSLMFNFGRKYFMVDMPWNWTWIKTEYRQKDGSWIVSNKQKNRVFSDFELTNPLTAGECADFLYKTKYNETYEVKAYFQERKSEWRWKWFQWFKFISLKKHSIDVHYVDNKNRISMLGTSYDIKKGETPIETLRKIEKTIIDKR